MKPVLSFLLILGCLNPSPARAEPAPLDPALAESSLNKVVRFSLRSGIVLGGGLAVFNAFEVLSADKTLDAALPEMGFGAGGMVLAGIGLALIPSAAHAGTPSDRFLSEKGFEDFLALSREQQLKAMRENRALAVKVMQMAEAIRTQERSEEIAAADQRAVMSSLSPSKHESIFGERFPNGKAARSASENDFSLGAATFMSAE